MNYLISLLVFLLAGFTLAAPTSVRSESTDISVISKRVTPVVITCPAVNTDGGRAWGHSYPPHVIRSAVDHLAYFMNRPDAQKPHWGDNVYPHRFRTDVATLSPEVLTALNDARERPECRTNQPGKMFFEYPMTNLAGNGPYTGGDPNMDRVIVRVDGTRRPFSNPVYCLSAAHDYRRNNLNFHPCT